MTKTPDIDQYWEALEVALPKFAPDEQNAAVTLYRELAKGRPVSAEQFAAALDVPVRRARELLERGSIRILVYADEDGDVLGFGGLAAPRPCLTDSSSTGALFGRGARGTASSFPRSSARWPEWRAKIPEAGQPSASPSPPTVKKRGSPRPRLCPSSCRTRSSSTLPRTS